MGEVYRARDTRLNRDIALKVLPEDFARDSARRQRFEQEACAVAALNHPNIVAVYDVGMNFLVSELVDGQTLRAAGKLSQRQAIDLAVQIAEGIGAAHAAGITHRDLKPDNIMVTRDGRAKILDFGLAKMTQQRAPGSPASEASTQTQEGMIVGTVGYMSPEQVKGLPADRRSDIFSFGLVLYEMLVGKRAFSGGSTIEVMNAILKEEPSELPESIAPGLKRIVEHCLDKNPDRRFQSALDLAFALLTPPSSGTQAALPSRSRRWSLVVAGAIAIAAVSIVASRLLPLGPLPLSWTGVMLGGPEMALNSRLSPDGHLLAFAAMVDGLTQVAVMKPESGNWTILTRDRSRGQVFDISWSPDGALIYYNRSNGVLKGVYSVPVLGGDEHLVLDHADNSEALPDGSLIVAKVDAERKRKLHHFWPGTGRLQELAVPGRLLRAFVPSFERDDTERAACGRAPRNTHTGPFGRHGDYIRYIQVSGRQANFRCVPCPRSRTPNRRHSGTFVFAAPKALLLSHLKFGTQAPCFHRCGAGLVAESTGALFTGDRGDPFPAASQSLEHFV
jgi:hypothetical protein